MPIFPLLRTAPDSRLSVRHRTAEGGSAHRVVGRLGRNPPWSSLRVWLRDSGDAPGVRKQPVPFSGRLSGFRPGCATARRLAVYAGGLAEMENCLHADYQRQSAPPCGSSANTSVEWMCGIRPPGLVYNQPARTIPDGLPYGLRPSRYGRRFCRLDCSDALLRGIARRGWSTESLRFSVAVPRAAPWRIGVGLFDLLARG
jgi:hypothetical protein